MNALAAGWPDTRGPQRLLYAVAVLFLVSGAFHVVVYALSGGAWEGAVSWRKPVEFSLSFAIATATFAWILGLLPRRTVQDCAFAIVYSVSSVGEVGLIILQRWRGTASHFNSATSFDVAVFSSMGVLIILVSLAVLWLTVRTFGSVSAGRAMMWAVRLGLLFFVVGLGIGFLLLGEGAAQASVGTATSPVTVGARGMLTLPHALALHGLQVLVILAWLGERLRVPERQAARLVLIVSAGYLVLLLIELSQALSGSGPLELAPLSAIALAISVALVCLPFAVAILRSERAEPVRP